MQLAVLLLLFRLLYSLNATAAEEEGESKSLCSFAEISAQDAVNALKKVMTEEKTVRKFMHEHVIENNAASYCGKPSNCADLFNVGFKESGIYKIYPKSCLKSSEVLVYCDMETDGGGWTVIQRRGDFREPHINFTKDWVSYSKGFGDLNEEFWLGNDFIHTLTTQDNVVVRFDLEDFRENHRFAVYSGFEVESKDQLYRVRVNGYSGNAGNSFEDRNGLTFVTYDFGDVNDCAKKYRGGWWYHNCHSCNPNGQYLGGEHSSFADGINWRDWLGHHYSLKRIEIKLRPKYFNRTINGSC